MSPRCVCVVAALFGVASAGAGCQRAPQRRPDGCPATFPTEGQACDRDPGHACFQPGGTSYACSCVGAPDGGRIWSCESAGGPLAPPDLPA